MTSSVTQILRHPLKSIGREALTEAEFSAGKWMPFDRKWAVAHERSKLDGGWSKKANFLRGVASPSLMAVEAKLDTAAKTLTLSHPTQDSITIAPDTPEGAKKLIDWLHDLWPIDLPSPTQIYRAKNAHLTDVPDPWIAINTTASLKSLSNRVGSVLSPHRFRGNIWIDGTAAWEEASWIGKTLKIGAATLEVKAQITRCKATMANPDTGLRDVDVLGTLNDLGHQEFGVYAQVVHSGRIALNDPVEIL